MPYQLRLNALKGSFSASDEPAMFDGSYEIGIAIGSGRSWGLRANRVSRKTTRLLERLWLENKISYGMLIGGTTDLMGLLTEADLMQDQIQSPEFRNNVLLESTSSDIHSNARETLRIMKGHSFKSVLIIAGSRHVKRVTAAFNKEWKGSGIKFIVVQPQGV
jgi:hypothetical protein